MGDLLREILIFAMLFVVILFILGIVFYDYIPGSKTVPPPITYMADSLVTSTLQEIAQSKDQSINIDTQMQPEWSYSISTSDLQSYASRKSYTSGKTNPFADYVEEEPVNSEENTENTTTSQNATSSPSSTGTYFEKSNSK